MDAGRLPDELPAWTPVAVAALGLLSIPLFAAVPRPPGYGTGPGIVVDHVLEAAPFVIAGIGAALGLVSEPGRARNPATAAAILVALAPLWFLPALGAVDAVVDEPIQVTVSFTATPEDPDEPFRLDVALTQIEPGSRAAGFLPPDWGYAPDDALTKVNRSGEVHLLVDGADSPTEVVAGVSSKAVGGDEARPDFFESYARDGGVGGKLHLENGTTPVDVTLTARVDDPDTCTTADVVAYHGTARPGNATELRYRSAPRATC